MSCIPIWNACNQQIDYINKQHSGIVTIPDDILRYGKSLEELLLDSNQLRELPKKLFQLTQLRKLTFSDNQVVKISSDIGQLGNLQEIDGSRNELPDVPDSIKHCKELHTVDFSNNPLQKFPQGFTQLQNLVSLNLNDISLGMLPPDFGNLTNLETLELRDNMLKYFPRSITSLSKLRMLDIGSNEFEELPDFIGSLTSLEELLIDSNELAHIPPEMCNLRKLTQLDVSENKIEKLPEELGNLVNLTDLLISENQVECLPDSIGLLKKLSILKADQNHLIHLTTKIGNCSSLQELILTENLILDIPTTVGKLKSLIILNLDRNRIQGVPKEVGQCIRLGVLSLRDNNISSLPQEIGNLRQLHVLDLSGNKLRNLPMSLSSCPLKAIWLSENQATPLLKFQKDEDENKEKILTCFLLPQQRHNAGDNDNFKKTNADNNTNNNDNDRERSWADQQRVPSIRFNVENETDQETKEKPLFHRQNTPFPKELKTRHKMLPAKDALPRVQNPKVAESETETESGDEKDGLNNNKYGNSVSARSTQGQNVPTFKILPAINRPDEPIKNWQTASLDTTTDSTMLSLDSGFLGNQQKRGFGLAKQMKANLPLSNGVTNPQPKIEIKSPLKMTGNKLLLNSVNNDDDDDASNDRMKVEKEMKLHFSREQGVGLGVSIAGGVGSTPFKGDDEGIFISRVTPGGPFHMAGIMVGDKLVEINGNSLVDADHHRAVAVLKEIGNEAEIIFTRMVAVGKRTTLNTNSFNGNASPSVAGLNNAEIIKATLRKIPGKGLGFSIIGGKESAPNRDGDESIYISKVNQGGLVHLQSSLEQGDRILYINGVDVTSIEHSEVVNILMTPKETLEIVAERKKLPSSSPAAPDEKADTRLSYAIGSASPLKINGGSFNFKPAGAHFTNPIFNSSKISDIKNVDVSLSPKKLNSNSSLVDGHVTSSPYSPKSNEYYRSEIPTTADVLAPGENLINNARTKPPPVPLGNKPVINKILKNESIDNDNKVRDNENDKNKVINDNDKYNGDDDDDPNENHRLNSLTKTTLYKQKKPKKSRTKKSSVAEESSEMSKSIEEMSFNDESFVDEAKVAKKKKAKSYPTETVIIERLGGALGMSIVGGVDRPCHPFGIEEPGVFISKVLPEGLAAKTNLRLGDRILFANGKDLRHVTHQEAVMSLISPSPQAVLVVQHDPQPAGLQELKMTKRDDEKLGISIKGGLGKQGGNPDDDTDEGIFISKINPTGTIARYEKLKVGQRILEVNGVSLLGVKHEDAVESLRNIEGDFVLLICDGYEPKNVPRYHSVSNINTLPCGKDSSFARERTGSTNKPKSSKAHLKASASMEQLSDSQKYSEKGSRKKSNEEATKPLKFVPSSPKMEFVKLENKKKVTDESIEVNNASVDDSFVAEDQFVKRTTKKKLRNKSTDSTK